MGREFELKFQCSPRSFAAIAGDYRGFSKIAMETAYFDTPSGQLGAMHWTLRRRMENGRPICTVKTPHPDGGRGEWEVESGDILAAIPELCKLGCPPQLLALTSGGVEQICAARFTRQALTLDVPGGRVELALDEGCLMGGGRECPLREVEVELKAGADRAAVEFAASLAEKYGLMPQPLSKYRRALALAKGESPDGI